LRTLLLSQPVLPPRPWSRASARLWARQTRMPATRGHGVARHGGARSWCAPCAADPTGAPTGLAMSTVRRTERQSRLAAKGQVSRAFDQWWLRASASILRRVSRFFCVRIAVPIPFLLRSLLRRLFNLFDYLSSLRLCFSSLVYLFICHLSVCFFLLCRAIVCCKPIFGIFATTECVRLAHGAAQVTKTGDL